MREKTMMISREEYEGMKETIEILQNTNLLKEIEKGLKELRKAEREGALVKLDL